jgi:hypothetical protein
MPRLAISIGPMSEPAGALRGHHRYRAMSHLPFINALKMSDKIGFVLHICPFSDVLSFGERS